MAMDSDSESDISDRGSNNAPTIGGLSDQQRRRSALRRNELPDYNVTA